MKKTILTTVLAVLGVSTAMAANIANFTNNTEQLNPYAQRNAQVESSTIPVQKVQTGMLNRKENNPLYKYTGATSQYSDISGYSVRVDH